MNRNLVIGLVAILVVIAIIAGGSVVLLENKTTSGNTSFTLKVGDFLKYNLTEHFPIQNDTSTTNYTYEILGVNATSIYYRVTDGYGDSAFDNSSINTTLFNWDPSKYSPDTHMNFTFLDKENLDTRWGELSTDHYNLTTDYGEWGDWWMRNGVVMKYSTVLNPGGVTSTFVLIDTNMPEVMG